MVAQPSTGGPVDAGSLVSGYSVRRPLGIALWVPPHLVGSGRRHSASVRTSRSHTPRTYLLMPKRPCLDCGVLTEASSYCPFHSRVRRAARQRRKKRSPSSERTRSAAWKRLRHQCLLRDGFACVVCGSRVSLEAHHLRAVADGGADSLDNLETRCFNCHPRGPYGE